MSRLLAFRVERDSIIAAVLALGEGRDARGALPLGALKNRL